MNKISNKLEWLEVGRGIAALAVTCVHLANMTSEPQYSGERFAPWLFHYWFLGVDFFFVLSGFIIYYVNHNSLGQSSAIPTYIWRRAIRILPTYWLVLTGAILINYLIQREKYPLSFVGLIQNYLLVASGDLWVGPAWTLRYEFLFYGLFVIGFWHKRAAFFAVFAWVAIAMVYWAIGFKTTLVAATGLLDMMTHLYSVNFLLGMIVAKAVVERKSLAAILFVSSGFCVVIAALLSAGFLTFESSKLARYILPSSAFCSALIGLIWLEMRSVKAPRALVFLGSISFTLYLVHIFPGSYLYAGLARLGLYKSVPTIVVFSLAVALAILIAWVVHRFFEQPVLAWGRKCEIGRLKFRNA